MKRISYLLALSLGVSVVGSAAADTKKPAPTKTPAKPDPKKPDPKAKKDAPPPAKKVVMLSAEGKKAVVTDMAGFKFGMTKDDVIKELSKQVAAQYDDKITHTEDTLRKDQLRKEKNNELKVVKDSYVEFNGTNVGGWDVSIIEGEFAHKTSESMLNRWENKD